MTRAYVSDYALLRFLERAGGLDVEGLRESIGASLDRSIQAASKMGATDIVVIQADGLRYIVRKGVVVTLLGPRRR